MFRGYDGEVLMLREVTGKPSAVGTTSRPRDSWAMVAWWMICRSAKGGVEVMTVPCRGGQALALFGHDEEAELFLWSLGEEGYGAGWRIRESHSGEVASVLYGPCVNVGGVVLDPLPAMVADGTAALASVDRLGFVTSLLAAGGASGGPSTRRTLRGRHPRQRRSCV
jgi:hypothetical protein